MDIAYYLSELLVEQDKVNVPGLGSFTQRKIDGYYNEQEAKFYPPGSEIIFDQHFTDDDTFAAYVGQQKKISLASSKYFIDKYISKMKTEAMTRDIPFGDLGSIHYEESGLSFVKAGTLTDDAAHYGYPQIEWPKFSGTSSPQQTETNAQLPQEEIPAPVVKNEPVAEPEALSIPPNNTEPPPVQQNEPVKPSIDFGAEMEDYLRELEAGTYIAGPVAEPVTEQEPVTEERTPEPVVPEVPIDVVLPGHVSEPVIPEAESIIEEHVASAVPVEVILPDHVPEPVIVEPVAEEHTPESEPYIQPVAPETPSGGEPHHEEEFVFDGKGYDDVDTRPAERRSYTWLWISLVVVIILGALVGFIYYRHQQALSKYRSTALPLKSVIKPDTSKKVSAIDSLNDSTEDVKDSTKNGVIKDTTQKATASTVVAPVGVASAIDSTKSRYELIGTSAKTMAEASLRVTNYKSLGISDAHILAPTSGLGRLIKVSLATYANRTDAVNKKRELLNTGNVRDIEIIKINPTK